MAENLIPELRQLLEEMVLPELRTILLKLESLQEQIVESQRATAAGVNALYAEIEACRAEMVEMRTEMAALKAEMRQQLDGREKDDEEKAELKRYLM